MQGPIMIGGSIYIRQGNFTQAMSDYNKAIGMNPNYAGVYTHRGVVYAKQGNFTQAISDFTKAIEINPKYAEAYYNRAGTYYQLRKYGNAWVDVHKAEELGYAVNPGFISALKKASMFSGHE